MVKLSDAVKYLSESYGDIAAEAKTYAAHIPFKDVEAAYAKAKPDTTEYVVLGHLLNCYELTTKPKRFADADRTEES